MAAIAFTKSLSLERGSSLHYSKHTEGRTSFDSLPVKHLEKRTPFETLPVNINFRQQDSSLYNLERVKRNINNSRRSFLNLEVIESETTDVKDCQDIKDNVCDKKKTQRKVSFKCKKPSNIYWKTKSSSNVIQLMLEEDKIKEEKNIMTSKEVQLKQTANTANHVPVKRVYRKPSVKTKPELRSHTIPRRKVSIKKKIESDIASTINEHGKDSKNIVDTNNEKITELLTRDSTSTNSIDFRRSWTDKSVEDGTKSTNFSKSFTKREIPTSVRAAIEIFESGTTPYSSVSKIDNSPKSVLKPKVPEKLVKTRTKELVSKNGVFMWKLVKTRESLEEIDEKVNNCNEFERTLSVSDNGSDCQKSENKMEVLRSESETYISQHTTQETEYQIKCDKNDDAILTDEDLSVQIINIPLTPPKRCDSIYETRNIRKTSNTTMEEKIVVPNNSFLWRRKSQEQLKKVLDKTTENNDNDNSSFGIETTNCAPLNTSTNDHNKTTEEILDNYEILPVETSEEDDTYDFVDTSTTSEAKRDKLQPPEVPPRPTSLPLKNYSSANKTDDKILTPENNSVNEMNLENKSSKSNHNYEELDKTTEDGYEYFTNSADIYEKIPAKIPLVEDGYEYCSNELKKEEERIYEVIPAKKDGEITPPPPPLLPKKQDQPLPPRPPSIAISNLRNSENGSSCYESIYNSKSGDDDENYEVICGANKWELPLNRHSIISCDQQSNSIYGRSLTGWPSDEGNSYSEKANSELSISDKSDEWIDISDHEGSLPGNIGLVIVREKQKIKKTGWPQKIRDQWSRNRSENSDGENDADHHYESLSDKKIESPQVIDDFDSFESDNESEISFAKTEAIRNFEITECQLPEPPLPQQYKFTKFAASAGKKMRKLKRNLTHHKKDITRSITWVTRRLSGQDFDASDEKIKEENKVSHQCDQNQKSNSVQISEIAKSMHNLAEEVKLRYPEIQINSEKSLYQNVEVSNNKIYDQNENEKNKNNNTIKKSKFLDKFRRSMYLSADSANELTQQLNKPRSTFYLSSEADIDKKNDSDVLEAKTNTNSVIEKSSSPKTGSRHSITTRPKCPPPPIPIDTNQNIDKNTNSRPTSTWYSEQNIPKTVEIVKNKSPSTSWYAEIGLYNTSGSTPSTSSAENSGTNTNLNISNIDNDYLNQKLNEEYYNMKNQDGNNYYDPSIDSFSSEDTKTEKHFDISHPDIQLHLEDEPLYQFYDAAISEDVCKDATAEFDYDGYEEVGEKQSYENYSATRPTAMQIIAPNRNGVTVARTLWCEIPEVIQSTVLSSLNTHQKKLQEAKFEMMTSEASYLNSLNVLTDHFIKNLNDSHLLTREEKKILFEKIPDVKSCSEKLLLDLEKCWQDNILLHGICENIQNHAKENFYVYVSYCENQILLDTTLKQIKERPQCLELLKQLESSHACQSLTLYSFLMLPMQRITRWPLLLDAVLKRLTPQDSEFHPCQIALAIMNKIVTECNEAARNMERITEMKKIESQLEFGKHVTPFKIAIQNRWLVRSGSVIQMQTRNDDSKLTFGRRFLKIPLHLFLFNDMLIVTKSKGDDIYTVLHYCMRSYIELNSSEIIPTMSSKDIQGRNLLFLTLLENHDGKTVEMLLSCSSESDRERWIEALSQPKSEDPDETLYECWDCPQVTVVHTYVGNQPDELTLCRGDVINVTRKMADGWYHGERIRDGQSGWFPSNYTVEIVNPHVRARNVRQRYRLLALTESYLKSK